MPSPLDLTLFDYADSINADWFRGRGCDIAASLLGSLLLADGPRGLIGGIVVETENYINCLDPASHLSDGRTPRTETFFSGAGTVYVYTIHGHHLLNIISTYNDYPEGILIRALEPTHGRDVMRDRRGVDAPALLTSGPGRLTEALAITTTEFDDRNLEDSRLSLYTTDLDPAVVVSSRVGVTGGADWPLRFTVAGNEFVSRPASNDEVLDHTAVKQCYEQLDDNTDDALLLDH